MEGDPPVGKQKFDYSFDSSLSDEVADEKSPLAACLGEGLSSRKKAEDFDDFYSDLDQNELMVKGEAITTTEPIVTAKTNDMQLKDLSESHASNPEVQVACNNNSSFKKSDLSPEPLPSSS